MDNKQIQGIIWTILAFLLIFGVGVAIGMYATHPLINIANISINNNTATLNTFNAINAIQGKMLQGNLVCFITFNNSVGWSSPYGCVK